MCPSTSAFSRLQAETGGPGTGCRGENTSTWPRRPPGAAKPEPQESPASSLLSACHSLTSSLSPSFVSLPLSPFSAPAPLRSFSLLQLEERVASCSVDGEEAAAPRSLRGLGRQARGIRGGDSAAAAPPSASSCRLGGAAPFPAPLLATGSVRAARAKPAKPGQ